MTSDEETADLTVENASAPKLPNMNEFSPGVLAISIQTLLKALVPLQGPDTDAMKLYLSSMIPKIANTTSSVERMKRAGNVLIGMSQCGLLEKDGSRKIAARFTDLSLKLVDAITDAEANDLFAAHLIENCHGQDLVGVVKLIRARGDKPTTNQIRVELRARGFEVTENEGNASKIRLWLQHANIVDEDWKVDEARLAQVIGATSATLSNWHGLSRPQRLLLLHLRELSACAPPEWVPVRQLKKVCELAHGRAVFPEGRLRADVIDPLRDAGWILADGVGSGRGGDSGNVQATPQLLDVKIELPLDTASSIPSDLIDKLGMPLDSIFADLKSPQTYTMGLALELLALRIVRDINLFPDGFRERSAKTGGAEVDLIANGVHLHYSRWLVQCKNTETVHVSAIAKEAGMALVLRAQVIMLITTGRFSRAVVEFAKTLAQTSSLQAVLIDKIVLADYRARGGLAIIEWLESSAHQVLMQKREQPEL